jgi:hypothetical protein
MEKIGPCHSAGSIVFADFPVDPVVGGSDPALSSDCPQMGDTLGLCRAAQFVYEENVFNAMRQSVHHGERRAVDCRV